ncbi:MBL fold metallo-hydrolase [Sphingomonas bacterium]|uniref:MBL fold metallo-hydrolase n=1 Tax=Sphingomonas bacterium TaxID=1895847 RepID=UPI001575078D|nr:MBL fold metallo-hydrolase [Sphingomonas bacterium]
MAAVLKIAGAIVLLLVILLGLAITVVPRFLDRIYYRGPPSDHFDGERFFNPGRDDTAEIPTGGSRIGFLWRYFTGRDGRPPWPERVEVHPSRPPARVEGERMLVTWIGHATVLVQTHGLNILTDPIWSDRTGPWRIGARRVAAPGVRFEDLPTIDLVLISHNHYDHLDLPTLRRLWTRDHPRIVTSLGNDAVIAQAGGAKATTADWGGEVPVGHGVSVVVVRAQHWGTRYSTDRNRALWSGFVVRLPSGGNFYFAADTGWGDGRWPAEAASHGAIRFAALPIGAFRFVPGQMRIGSHMGPIEAVRVFDRTGAGLALPIHWGTFRLSFESHDTPPRMLAALMRCTGNDPARFAAHAIGMGFEVPPVSGPRPPLDLSRLDACAGSAEVRALQ